MDLGNGLGHLTYSTLVHAGDTWSEMWDSLNRYVPQVKARVSPKKTFGVSLRLSASSAQTLTGNRDERSRLSSSGSALQTRASCSSSPSASPRSLWWRRWCRHAAPLAWMS